MDMCNRIAPPVQWTFKQQRKHKKNRATNLCPHGACVDQLIEEANHKPWDATVHRNISVLVV